MSSSATGRPAAPSGVGGRAEFLPLGNRVRGAGGARAVQLAYAALALHAGSLLPSDRYAAGPRSSASRSTYRHLALLDLVAADAMARGLTRRR